MCLRGAGDGLARSNERPRAEDDDVPALVHAQQAHGSGTTYSRRAARERADDGQSQGLFQRTLPRLAGPLRRARHLKHRSEDLDVNETPNRAPLGPRVKFHRCDISLGLASASLTGVCA